MKTLLNSRYMAALGLLVMALLAMPAFADYVFDADMTGDQVYQPSGSTAYGHATLIMNEAQTQIAYTVNFAGLDAGLTSTALFRGAPGTVGTEALLLPGDSPMAGIWNVDGDSAAALMDEAFYINVFSDGDRFPYGEIRGNFTLTIVADEPTSWDNVKALYR
jgi:hypothetical protein